MKQGYTGPQVCKIVGISYRQLDHWTTTKLIKSSLRNLKGSGHHREYSFEDLLKVKKQDSDLRKLVKKQIKETRKKLNFQK